MDSLELGINRADADLALAGFYKRDTEWLDGQHRWVDGVIKRLDGHRCQLHYASQLLGAL